MYFDYHRVDSIGTNDMNAGGTNVLQPGAPVDIKRVIFVITTTTVGTSTVSFGTRDADGGNSTTLGSFTIAATTADGVVHAIVAGEASTATGVDGSSVNGPTSGLVQVNPGQEFFVTTDATPTAGAAEVYVEYLVQGFSGSRVADATEATVTFA